MIQIKEIVNSIFTSKTYILFCEGEDKAWLVDIGDIEPVVAFLQEKKLMVEGVFLTHGHFDHIYGLPSLLEHYSQRLFSHPLRQPAFFKFLLQQLQFLMLTEM